MPTPGSAPRRERGVEQRGGQAGEGDLTRWRLRLIGVSADGTVYRIHRDTEARGDSAEVRLPGLATPIMVRLVTPLGVGDSIRVRYDPRRPGRARHVDWSARGLIRSTVGELVGLALLAGVGYLGFLLVRGLV